MPDSHKEEPTDPPGHGGSTEQLIEAQAPLLHTATTQLEALSSWNLGAPVVLVNQAAGGSGQILAIGQLGHWLEHLPPALDGFVRRRKRGLDLDEAYRLSLEEDGADFVAAWEQARQSRALICHDDLAHFASLCQQGFQRDPRELLVVVRWPEQVTAFLLGRRLKLPGS